MEWLSTTEERSQTVASISRAFEVLRQNPTKCNELAQKEGRKTRSAVENPTDDDLSEIPIVIDVSDQDVEAFPPLTDVDSTDCRKERVEAYLSFSEDLKRRYQEFSSRSDLNACEDLWFNFVMHQDPTITSGSFSSPVRRTPSARLKLGVGNAPTIATAILSARGIGSDVDAFNLYPALVKYLTDRKAYVAHLTDKDLDGGVGAAVHAVLHQLMGPQTQDWGANDVEALYSWYADQTTSVVVDHPRACCAPQPAETSEGAAHKSAPSSSTVSYDKKAQSVSRQLRQRRAVVGDEKGSKKPSAATGLPGVGADLFAATKRANQRRPVVLLIQSAERMDVSCFRDLVKLFSVDHPRFPVSLVLGSSVPHDVLTANLSTDVLSRLRLKPLSLQPQKDRLNSFFQGAL
ncbi:hypothetical protein CEUSTIGMA_g11691.t1 [Chlamydomonas eustigma]|uniref:Origin recognition complex subunit 3 N-terminal domain-containing protein n=1 Tax=Chlamydomonas eustigma TaxID=1157962 RepID=A0A250XMH1_9CHLO|nr:hypothetical protein CEUSTIGMA_g11691.t1 [Chlamydomonas eustigma]|eukprot:GAX84268.1 hypothetical protein CEUSTIGMA_g11691.t1 [Chlamydomonas eustigma]